MLSEAQRAAWARDGFLLVPGFAEPAACARLIERSLELLDDPATWPPSPSVFTTHEQTRTSDEWFLSSGDQVRCFYEEEAIGPDGSLAVPRAQAVNKIGHAQHDLDPVYDAFSRTPALGEVAHDIGLRDPVLLQSMHIFKQPHIGGEVTCHQDATFLPSDPITVTGFWFALEDATIANGCLWAAPGGHRGPLRRRFR